MRILVCDDNADAADTLAALLRGHGHEVIAAYDGRACLEKALQWKPRVAFLDIGMPEVDGYRVARKLRTELGAEVLLVAVTGYGSREDIQQAIEAGFDIHMSKPADFTRLVSAVEARIKTSSDSNVPRSDQQRS
jgi:CheY-like chemotaxis protein